MAPTMKVVRKRHRKLDLSGLAGPKRVKVGFPASKASGSNIEKAVWNEFGTRGGGWGGPIPERPFMRNAMREGRAEFRDAMRKSAPKILSGETSLPVVLNKLGALGQKKIQQSITKLTSPENSPVTIKLKGSSKPLIDTGAMRQAVTWIVED